MCSSDLFHKTGIWIRGGALALAGRSDAQAIVNQRGPGDLILRVGGNNVARFAADGSLYLLGGAGFAP